MAMDSFLAEYYATAKTASAAETQQEDLEKQASVQLFLKLASEQNIDLKAMPDDQVTALYNNWVKAANDEHEPPKPEKKDEEKEKVEKAKEEHEEKKAAAEKFAEADFLGRVMAHSYVQELRKIAEATATPGAAEAAAAAATTEKEAAMPEALRKGLESVKHHGGKAMEGAKGLAGKAGGHLHAAAEKGKEVAKKHGPGAAVGAAAGAAGGAAAMHHKNKHSSALDELAGERAVYLAHEAGLDAEQIGHKIAAVLTLGVKDSEKIAAAPDLEAAVGVRALELLEAIGVPVEWNT